MTKYKNEPGFHYFSDASDRLELIRIDYQPTLVKRLFRQSAIVRYTALNLQLNWQSIENAFENDAGKVEEIFVGNTCADFDEERISDSKRVVDTFIYALPLQTGLENDKILFVMDGMRLHIYNPTTLKKANGSYFDLIRKYIFEVAVNNGYEEIDMQPSFIMKHESEGIRFEYTSDGHWNEAGHILVAEKI
ncbi:MAG: hypothetical protein JSV33_03100 [bacterium]|nr:MAG: hypothetical protein JSV33_03100 [bacterium]